jgi:ubiquinone/menaquinone biosynthesis C-methylase UbiE
MAVAIAVAPPALECARMSFDNQAATFARRAGLSTVAAKAVATAVVSLGDLGPGDLLVEVGAGSGEIGCHLVGRVRYIGFDLAPSMLDLFRERLGARAQLAALVVADGDARWPVAERSARAIFASRSLHLLSLPQVLAEIHRVGSPEGVTLLVGRVARDEQSVRMWMRRQMRCLLRKAGIQDRPGGRQVVRDVIEACAEADSRYVAAPIAPHEAARWSVAISPADSLAAWAGKDGLAGFAVDARTKRAVLERLRSHALVEFGDLNRPIDAVETYVLEGARFSPAAHGRRPPR